VSSYLAIFAFFLSHDVCLLTARTHKHTLLSQFHLGSCIDTNINERRFCHCITARKASCTPACVEPVHWKQADIDPGSLLVVRIGKYVSSEIMSVVQIKPKGVYGVENTLRRSFLGGSFNFAFVWSHKQKTLLSLYHLCSCLTLHICVFKIYSHMHT